MPLLADALPTIFRMKTSELTEQELALDYVFYGNAFSSGDRILWTIFGGSAEGMPFDGFIKILREGDDHAFGPAKKQKGWTLPMLNARNAVGLYRRLKSPERAIRPPNKPAKTRSGGAKERRTGAAPT